MPPNAPAPELSFGHLIGGWLTRPNEAGVLKNQPIVYGKATTAHGKRPELIKLLLNSLPDLDKEAGVLTALIIEDATNENVVYFLNRLADKALGEKMMSEGGERRQKFEALTESREGGAFKFFSGFLHK
jgi:quinol monooxygenase YgiN